jgi:hypothetical protein
MLEKSPSPTPPATQQCLSGVLRDVPVLLHLALCRRQEAREARPDADILARYDVDGSIAAHRFQVRIVEIEQAVEPDELEGLH